MAPPGCSKIYSVSVQAAWSEVPEPHRISLISEYFCRRTKPPAKFDAYLLPDIKPKHAAKVSKTCCKRKASSVLACPHPPKRQAGCDKNEAGKHASSRSPDHSIHRTQRLVIKLKANSNSVAKLDVTNGQLSKPDAITAEPVVPKLSPSSADAAALHGALPQLAPPKRPAHKAAPVERPVTRRFKLQQSSSIRVSIKLKKPLGSSGLSARPSTLRHQRKRQATDQSPDALQRLPAPLRKKTEDAAAQASDTQPSDWPDAARAADTQPQPASAEPAPAQDPWQPRTPADKLHACKRLCTLASASVSSREEDCKGSPSSSLSPGAQQLWSHYSGSQSGKTGHGVSLSADSTQDVALLHSGPVAPPQSRRAKAAQMYKGSLQNSPTDHRAALPSNVDRPQPAAAVPPVPDQEVTPG